MVIAYQILCFMAEIIFELYKFLIEMTQYVKNPLKIKKTGTCIRYKFLSIYLFSIDEFFIHDAWRRNPYHNC